MIKLIATASGQIKISSFGKEEAFKCAIGRSGMIAAADKREGDGASPAGVWPMRRVYYRADRMEQPETGLPCEEIRSNQGWCDAPDDPAYNRLITLPYTASHELMWREDHVYDVVVELGHNDSPPVPGLGSAVFMHLARADYSPTQGCIALALEDMLKILRQCNGESELEISF